jgi:hypothetical protein
MQEVSAIPMIGNRSAGVNAHFHRASADRDKTGSTQNDYRCIAALACPANTMSYRTGIGDGAPSIKSASCRQKAGAA